MEVGMVVVIVEKVKEVDDPLLEREQLFLQVGQCVGQVRITRASNPEYTTIDPFSASASTNLSASASRGSLRSRWRYPRCSCDPSSWRTCTDHWNGVCSNGRVPG
jgi:hypothetical protein